MSDATRSKVIESAMSSIKRIPETSSDSLLAAGERDVIGTAEHSL